jgi:DNA-3-methyladenine glycosylase I
MTSPIHKKDTKKRCGWCKGDELYQAYHDLEWGTPNYDDGRLFEFLLLEGAQAGLSWITVLRKRENYRRALDGFDAEKIARYGASRKAKLLADPGIIRNRLKVDSAIRNARVYLEIKQKTGSFSDYLWKFVDHRPIQHRYRSLKKIPALTKESDLMSKALKKEGFNFVGSTICYAFMQATGMVNDHLVNCHRHEECRRLGQ